MKTEPIQAWQLEQGDLISLGGNVTFTIHSIGDEPDSVDLTLTDEDGETDYQNPVSFLPDEEVALVVSLEDDE